MTVGEVMHAGIISCRPETTLRTVAGILAAHRIHAVVVAAADADAGWSVVSAATSSGATCAESSTR